ncbi:MAG: antibiotic biosynthesis monooxygenase family protein [Terracidiphilus sp.]|jgi:heme-degrading monooxygenase HmoA
MIHAVRFYLVAPEKVSAFTSMFRDGGLYRELVRHLQPGLIAIDLLRSNEIKTAYLTLELWLSADAYHSGQNAPAQSVLIKLLRNMTISCLDLGPFTFPPSVDNAYQWQDVSTTAVAHCVKDHGHEDA